MSPIDNFVILSQATDLPSRTLFATELGAFVSAVAAVFAAISALAAQRAVHETRAARRPLLDVVTQAGEVQFRWTSQPSEIVWPHREVRYFAKDGDPAPEPASSWNFIVNLMNLSESGATGIMSTLELRPALTPRDVAMLKLSEGVGGDARQRLSWADGRYTLHGSKGGCGWFDAFSQPLGRITNVPALGVRPATLSYHMFENLLLLLYREALLVARVKTRDVMCRPSLVYRLSYRGPTGERLYQKYVIDLTIQHLTFNNGEHQMDSVHGVPSSWQEFDARVTLAMRDATDGLPWRFRLSKASRVWRHLLDANQGHFGFRRDSSLRTLRRLYLRWPALLGWCWTERRKWWSWRVALREAPP